MPGIDAQAPADGLLYLEDLAVGAGFVSGEHRLSEAEIIEFARRYDPQPFHLDADLARRSFFGGLAASGWQVAALTMRLLVDGGLPIAGGLIGVEATLRWPRPTRPGDVLHVEAKIAAIGRLRSRPDRGIVTVTYRTLNQRGEEVQTAETRVLVFARGASVNSSGDSPS